MSSGKLSGVDPIDRGSLSEDDREIASAVAQVIAGLHHDAGRDWREVVRRLECDDWEVKCQVGFVAEARRGSLHEVAFGRTREQAVIELLNQVLMDDTQRCP